MQIDDYRYFERNMRSFYKRYGHKFLAIKGKKVIGVYDTFSEGLHGTAKTEKPGTFLIQECFPNKEASIHRFPGNVKFSVVGVR